MTDFIDEVMGFNPSDLSAFNEPEQKNYDVNIYKTNPKDAKSEDGAYRSKIRVIYNPFNPKDSIVHQATYFLKSMDGSMLIKSRLGNGPSDSEFKNCPIFKGWKSLWFSGDDVKKDFAKTIFQKNESDWVLVQILEDENKPELVGQFKIMKLAQAIKDKLVSKMNPSKESKKTPYPVMDYVIGLELNMEVTPGPDDPAAPERKQREISYNICDFGDYAPIIKTDGTPLFTDEEIELIDSYVTAIKDSTSAKTEAKKKAATNLLETLRPQLKPLYQKAYDYVKENALDLRKEAGFQEWDENTTKKVNQWLEIVADGKDPQSISYETFKASKKLEKGKDGEDSDESPAEVTTEPAEISAGADDLPF